MIRDLVRHFMTPDDHAGNPAGFVLTQAAHFGAVGAPAFWLASVVLGAPAAVALVAGAYAALEAAQTRFGRQTFGDALTDWGFVMLGATFMFRVVQGDHWGAIAALAAAAALAAVGAAARG